MLAGHLELVKMQVLQHQILRTVFYSTLNKSGEEATIGVANLPSYELEKESAHTQGTEFFRDK